MVLGSFTGIRIGISTVKAFNDCLNITSIGVNSLEALKYNVTNNNIVCCLIDARKNNVYCELFENDTIILEPFFDNIDNFLINLKKLYPNKNIAFVGDGSINYKNKILSNFPECKFATNNTLSATAIGITGFNNYTKGLFCNVEPLYLRKSEAEQKMEAKLNGAK